MRMQFSLMLSLAIALCTGAASYAQVSVQNNGTLFVSGSTTLYVNGDLTNASGAGLTNNGSLYINQSLVNNQSSMAIGTGTLYFNGTSAQALSGTQPFYTYNFVSNNGSGITLNADLSVSGTHTFSAG
ncbi:MAG: hypothetical protein JST39_05825, partial [Bacteroidetes bacterium]|nr:hypothetical protein [Bacteroidota bacterium]